MKKQARQHLPISIGVVNRVGHNNMLQLIQLRWIAVLGQLTTIVLVTLAFDIHLPLVQMLQVLGCLTAFNIASHLRWHERPIVTSREMFFAFLVDVGILTAQLYLSGGITNPFLFLYLLQVILGAVLLETWASWSVAVIISLCLLALSLFSEALVLPVHQEGRLSPLYLAGILICFVLNAVLLVFFIVRIKRNLWEGSAQLADLQQRAAEEDQIVRMGLLASGAAHELGTPLATLSVILGDWRHMPEFSQNVERQEEIREMQTQLQHCKNIVSSILLSAGEARGESAVRTTIHTFMQQLITEWRTTRAVETFVYENDITSDIPVVFDSTLKQMICNVLDNALEASPNWLSLKIACVDGWMTITVMDAGSGFAPTVLAQLGKPYQSTKQKLGRGLGLFFAMNVARKLGGVVTAYNRAQGGAVVEMSLPLAALSL